MTLDPPIRPRKTFDRELAGVFGEFGSGGNATAFYLQTALAPEQLSWTSLISDIRGSELWPVRDLFQRDVDNERITTSLLPYLQSADKIKFFNPLTLTLLPMTHSDHVDSQMPRAEKSVLELEGRRWQSIARGNYYRIRWIEGHPEYGMLEWSALRCRLVAIDGQHRLAALKRYRQDGAAASHAEFLTWRIPIVVVSFRADLKREPPSVLEVIRSIFVYINTEAHEVSRSRQILLSDSSVPAICTQEILQRAHTNDQKPALQRRQEFVPLLFYDWRGEERGKQPAVATAAVTSVDEVHDWVDQYLLDDECSVLRVASSLEALSRAIAARQANKPTHLNSAAAQELRALVAKDFLPGVSHVLEAFTPFARYIAELRRIETECRKGDADLARHAFHQLRFGTNHGGESISADVNETLRDVASRIEAAKKDHLPELFRLDIGFFCS